MLQWLISKTPPKLPSESRKHRKAHWLRCCGSGGSEGGERLLDYIHRFFSVGIEKRL